MKKFISVLLSVMIAVLCAVPVLAEDVEEYDIIVSIPEVIVYDETINGVPGGFNGWLAVTVSFNNIERYKNWSVSLESDKELLRYETATQEPIRTYIAGCFPSEKGVVFSARLGEMAVPETSYSCSTTGFLKVFGTGEHKMKLSVDVRDKNDNPVDVKVKYKAPYERIVDISEVATIAEDKFDFIQQYALVDYRTTAAELVSKEGSGNVIVIDSEGNVLANDAAVPNGAYLATMYEGFVVDKVQFCVMEDVNCDGKITAADARLTLRCAAKLENLQGVVKIAADMNLDNKITAADARLIIRKAAKLDVSDIPGKEEPPTEIDKFTVSAVLKSEYVNKQEECKEYFEDCEYIKGIIVFSTTDCEVGLEFSLTGTGAENFDATVEFIKNSGFFSAVYYHKA